jgi:ech hydrogenase subunit F
MEPLIKELSVMFKMTPNILRNLVRKKSTRRYPYETRDPFAGTRGELINNMDHCTLCGVCAAKCPSQCIVVDKKAGLWTCDPFACVYCAICVDTCPSNSLSQKRAYRAPSMMPGLISLKGQPRKMAAPKTKKEDQSAT